MTPQAAHAPTPPMVCADAPTPPVVGANNSQRNVCPAGKRSVANYSPLRRAATIVALAVLSFSAACARAQTPAKRLVIIVVPGLRADDLTRPDLPALQSLVRYGAVGWMNTRTARVPGQTRDPEEAAYVTLGAGARATAGPYARVVTPTSLARLKRDNARLDHPVPVGALGDLLKSAGVFAKVIGCEDGDAPRRAATWIVRGSDPATSVPTVPALDRGPAARLMPYSVSDSQTTWINNFLPGQDPSVMLFVVGDVARADRYNSVCLPRVALAHREKALNALDDLIGMENLLSTAPIPSRIVLLSPSPADSAAPGDRLAPILMWGDGVPPGLLTSGSTHTPGLVTNTDFLPTVAAYFGMKPPPGAVGRPITVVPLPPHETFLQWLRRTLHLGHTPNTEHRTPNTELWRALHDRWQAQARKQAAFGGLPSLQLALVLLGTLAALPGLPRLLRAPGADEPAVVRHPSPVIRHLVTLSPCHLVICLPLALLVLPPVSPTPVWAAGLLLGAALVAVAAVGAARPPWARGMALAMLGALVVVAALDLVTGAHLMRQAWMSYSVMEGARYYGVGNEYAGALVAAGLLVCGAWLAGGRARQWPAALAALLVLALVIGWPALGANAGGFLGAAVGAVAAGLVWWRGRLRAREVVLALGAVALLLATMLAWDLSRGGAQQSHIAFALGSHANLLNVMARKAALNGWLLLHSPWSLALLASLGCLWLQWRAPESRLRAMVRDDRGARGAAVGLAAGALALLLLNDSGVVSAAEAMLLAWAGARTLTDDG